MSKMTRLRIIIVASTIVGCIILGLIIWTAVHHLTKTTPFLSFEPMPDDGTLIAYANRKSQFYWTQKLDAFLKPYTAPIAIDNKLATNITTCQKGVPPEVGSNLVCEVDYPKSFSPCIREYFYGYHRSAPCVFLVFNTPPDWQPEYYYNSSVLPANMPETLKNNIREKEKRSQIQVMWVSCEGETAADKEFIGPLLFLPQQGFDGQYFPIVNQESYIKPLMAIQFERPTTGVVINVECKAWAKNLNHEKGEGVIHFQLMLDL